MRRVVAVHHRFQAILLPASPSGSMRDGLSCASSRNGRVSDSTLDLPVPLLPRSSRWPSRNQNSSLS